MDSSIIIMTAIGVIAGAVVMLFITKVLLRSRTKNILEDARKEAESMKRTKMLETKEKCIQMKSEMEQQINARYSKLQSAESKAQQRESQLNQQQQELQRKRVR